MKTRLTELLAIDVPIVQAPMAGSSGAALAIEVALAGGLGSLPCAVLGPDSIRSEVSVIRERTQSPINLNFFCHMNPADDSVGQQHWDALLAPYFTELGVDQTPNSSGPARLSFDSAMADIVEELRPAVVSFHFGLPESSLVDRVHSTGAMVLSSATTVDEARWLQEHGCDIVIAQGAEAGGHRAMFLTSSVPAQIGTMALVPQVVDAVSVPVIAAGGITDARGIAAALVLGADGVQIGTGFLLCPEATTAPAHRRAVQGCGGSPTVLTNVFTGRPARSLVNRVVSELGPMSNLVPRFPLPATAMMALRARAEADGSTDFTPLWCGQAGALARPIPAGELIRTLVADTQRLLGSAAQSG